MKGQRGRYTAAELAFIEAHRLLRRAQLHVKFVEAFERTDVSLDHLKALCTRRKWAGTPAFFVKGQQSHNKGKAMPFNANSARTQFKQGSRNGRALERHKPIGTVRMNKDGYAEIKVHDGLPMRSRWRLVHLVNWEQLNGPVPKGMCLKSRDGDRKNADASNWQLVPRSMLPRLAGAHGVLAHDDAPDEMKPTVMAIAQVEQAARVRRGVRRATAPTRKQVHA